jgi:hypothetical protein
MNQAVCGGFKSTAPTRVSELFSGGLVRQLRPLQNRSQAASCPLGCQSHERPAGPDGLARPIRRPERISVSAAVLDAAPGLLVHWIHSGSVIGESLFIPTETVFVSVRHVVGTGRD